MGESNRTSPAMGYFVDEGVGLGNENYGRMPIPRGAALTGYNALVGQVEVKSVREADSLQSFTVKEVTGIPSSTPEVQS